MSKIDTPPDTPTKPLLFADDIWSNERLDEVEAAERRGHDPSYLPGYSEAKTENEVREARGQPREQIDRYQWVRVSRPGGTNVTEADEAMIQYRQLGYRAVGIEDLENDPVVEGMPPTATVGPDGLIRRGDLALFVVGGERAERNRRDVRRANEENRERQRRTAASDTGEIYRDEDREHREKGSLADLAQVELPKD